MRSTHLLTLFLLSLVAGGVLVGCSTTRSVAPRSAAADDPNVVATFADTSLRLGEFEEQYARSVGGREAALDDSLPAYQDFLERYVDFRLKVLAAEQAGYADSASVRQEITNYRSAFAKPYLLDKEVMDPIIENIFERNKEMIRASHILLRVAPDASPEDTLAAYRKMAAIVDSARKGVDFGDLAFRNSEDPSARTQQYGVGYRGDLGYFSAGRMVVDFEDMAYATPVGEVSPIFRTRFGYHVLKVNDRREAVQPVRVSHILIRPKGKTAADSAEARQLITDLKQRIEGGESFRTIAAQYSQDPNSAPKGGDIGFVRFDNYQIAAPFREAVFAMNELNTVSDVVETQYGYHLIMVTERKAPESLDEQYDALKKLASKLPRTNAAQNELATEILQERGATIDTTALASAFASVPMDSLAIRFASDLPAGTADQVVATLGDSTYTLARLSAFVRSSRVPRMQEKEAQLVAIADAFLHAAAIDYEAAALEERDPEFARIMHEFKDGLMLFRFMEDSVWTAAAQDSAALQAYYDAHADAYRFPDRTRIIELYAPSDSLLQEAMTRLDGGLTLPQLQAEVAQNAALTSLRIDTVFVAQATNSIYDQALALQPGAHTETLASGGGHVVLFNDGIEPARPKTFAEARPEVVNDYQQVLEDEVVARLRERFDARTYPERVRAAFTSPASEAGTSQSTQ